MQSGQQAGRVIRWGVLCAALLVGAKGAAADEQAAGDAGRRVLVVTPGAELKLEDRVVGVADIGHVYTISKTNGGWLWVAERGGWIRERDVVDASRAIDHFTEKIRRDPAVSAAWRERGRAHDALGNLDAALDDFSRAIEQTPSFADAYNDRGNIWFKKGDLDKARADYTAAIERNPDLAVAYNNRSTVRARQGDLDGAREDLDAALRLDPKYAEAWNNRGVVHRDQGNFAQAIADYSKALELAPDYAAAYGNRGFAWKQQREYRKALDDYRRALELAPRLVFPRNDLAWLLATAPQADLRDGTEAVRQATLVIELAGETDWNHLDTRAAAHAEAGQFDEAIRWAEKALNGAPDDQKPAVRARLELYKTKQPYHEPAAQ